MSIATEISRLQAAKADIKAAIEAKGVTVPAAAKLDTYDDYVAQISGGGSPVIQPLNATANGKYTAPAGVDGYSPVTVNTPERWPSIDNSVGLPNGYTHLVGLELINNSGYFNTGVAADSGTGIEVTFSVKEFSGTQPAFGIRRASGNTDTKRVGCYITNTSWNGINFIYGPLDESRIQGSLCASHFRYAKIVIAIKHGILYNDGRPVYDASAQSFYNTDGVPLFLGALAKTSSTIYGSGTGLRGIYFGCRLWDSNDNLIRDFIPCLDASGNMGFYDKVSSSFTAVNNQNYWSPITPAHFTARKAAFNALSSGITSATFQSCAEVNGWKLVVCDTQEKFLLINTPYQSSGQGGVVLTCLEYNANWHGNACWFGSEKYDNSDLLPLLYVSTDKDSALLTVYRISGTSQNDFAISLVQKIYTPSADTSYGQLYYHNYYGKAGCSTFVETAYITNSFTSGTNIAYRIYSLPAISAGDEVALTEADIIQRGLLPFVFATSNGGWNGKYLYVSSSQANKNKVYFFKIERGGTASAANFINISTGDDSLISVELEGLSWVDAEDRFVMLSDPTSGYIHNIWAEDLVQYADNVYIF